MTLLEFERPPSGLICVENPGLLDDQTFRTGDVIHATRCRVHTGHEVEDRFLFCGKLVLRQTADCELLLREVERLLYRLGWD
jgi:hypothetical protein